MVKVGSKDNKCDKRICNLNATTTCSPVNLTSEDVKTDTSDAWSKSDTAVAKSWKRFSKDETVLLLSVWEGQFNAFTEKKKVKQDDWDDLTVAYNTEAAAYGFQSRKSSQVANCVNNLKDRFKNILDKKNTTGKGVETDGSEKSFPSWDFFSRVYSDREKFNPTNVVDPDPLPKQSISRRAPSSSDPDTSHSDADESTIDKERLKPKASDDEKPNSKVHSKTGKTGADKKNRSRKRKTVDTTDSCSEDKLLEFLAEFREQDTKLIQKLIDQNEKSDKRNAELSAQIIRAISLLVEPKQKKQSKSKQSNDTSSSSDEDGII